MKRKIILSLALLFIFLAFGVTLVVIDITRTTDTIKKLLQLHEIDDMRKNLLLSVQTVQSDLYTVNTMFGQKIDNVSENMAKLDEVAQKCTTCHHAAEVLKNLNEIQAMIKEYETTLSYYITASANKGMIEKLKADTASIGNELLLKTEAMSVAANSRLRSLSRAAMEDIEQAQYILYATICAIFVIGIMLALNLIRSVTRPIDVLVNATRKIASGQLGYNIQMNDKTEFGELAMHFNEMSNSLKKNYAELQSEIREREAAQKALTASESFLSTIFDSIRDPFCIFDSGYNVVRVNEAYEKIKGIAARDLIGRKCYIVMGNGSDICESCVVRATLTSKDPCAKDKTVFLQDGTQIWLDIYTYPVIDKNGEVSHVIEYTRDVTDRKKADEERQRLIEELNVLSRTDSLTGMPNRRALIEMLEYETGRAVRFGSELSLMLCDIDRFKEINDTYGHHGGDRALRFIADKLRGLLRKADIVGRYGGDEFMLILPGTPVSGAENIAEKIRDNIAKTDFKLTESVSSRVSLSIGVTGFGAEADDIDAMIRRSDNGLYLSKQAGRNKVNTVVP